MLRRKGLTSPLPSKAEYHAAQVAKLKDDGMNEDEIREVLEGMDQLNRMVLGGWFIYLQQFVLSFITAFPFCLIVGGIKLWFFE